MIGFLRDAIEAARADHLARRALAWECVALQHQLAVLRRSETRRPRFRPIDRLFWVFMSWWWPAWRDALVVIQSETVLRWRRHGIALIWKYRSHGRWRGGRPRIFKSAPRYGVFVKSPILPKCRPRIRLPPWAASYSELCFRGRYV